VQKFIPLLVFLLSAFPPLMVARFFALSLSSAAWCTHLFPFKIDGSNAWIQNIGRQQWSSLLFNSHSFFPASLNALKALLIFLSSSQSKESRTSGQNCSVRNCVEPTGEVLVLYRSRLGSVSDATKYQEGHSSALARTSVAVALTVMSMKVQGKPKKVCRGCEGRKTFHPKKKKGCLVSLCWPDLPEGP
jgi:hypothetical protein